MERVDVYITIIVSVVPLINVYMKYLAVRTSGMLQRIVAIVAWVWELQSWFGTQALAHSFSRFQRLQTKVTSHITGIISISTKRHVNLTENLTAQTHTEVCCLIRFSSLFCTLMS